MNSGMPTGQSESRCSEEALVGERRLRPSQLAKRALPSEGDPYFTGKLQNRTAVEKDQVKLVCELSKASADVKWFHNDKELTPSKNVSVGVDGKKRILLIRKAEMSDAGEYACDCGSDATRALLTVEGKRKSPALALNGGLPAPEQRVQRDSSPCHPKGLRVN